jgi:two-component system sensor kinase FixL
MPDEHWRAALSVGAAGAWDWEVATNRVHWGPGVGPLFGLAEEQVDHSLDSALAAVHDEDRPLIHQQLQASAETMGPYRADFRVWLPNGQIRWLGSRGRAIADANGQAQRVIGAVFDLTEQKRQEDALAQRNAELEERMTERMMELEEYSVRLAQAEQHARALGDWLPFGNWVCEADGSLRHISQAFLDLVGMTLSEARAQGWTHLMPSQDRTQVSRQWAHCLATGEEWDCQYHLEPPRGQRRTILSRARPVRDVEGRIVSWVGVNLDITEREQAKHLLAQREAELAHAGRLGLMGELASGLAHELNQPLAAITTYAQGCLHRLDWTPPDREGLGQGLDHIIRQAERAGRIIRHLREFARVGEPTWAITGVNELIEEVIELVNGDIRHNDIDLVKDLSPHVPRICVGRIEIEQVLVNLMRNAIEAMSSLTTPPRQLTVQTRPLGQAVRLTVADTGPGVSDEALAHMFDPFYTTKATGMGVGLNLCETLVQHHQGQLWAERNAHGGLSLHLQLPVHLDEGESVELENVS